MVKIKNSEEKIRIRKFLKDRKNEVKIPEYIKTQKCLDILNRIQVVLHKGDLYEAKLYTSIEIDNLKGITEKTCKNRYEGLLDEYCKKCSNYNCNLNKNTKK